VLHAHGYVPAFVAHIGERRLGWEIEQLAEELAELFGGHVDLVSSRALHPLLRPSVLAEARPVYAA